MYRRGGRINQVFLFRCATIVQTLWQVTRARFRRQLGASRNARVKNFEKAIPRREARSLFRPIKARNTKGGSGVTERYSTLCSCTRCGTQTSIYTFNWAVLAAVLPRRTSTMTSRRRFIAICFGLAAWFWCTADAVAQAQPTSPQPGDADHPTVAKASSSINWDTIRWVERRYKIEAIRFKALDETGFDWPGSDDVMVETTDAKGWTVSNEIRGIDSGDTHNFD